MSFSIDCSTTGIKELTLSQQIKVYPNPASTLLTIDNGNYSLLNGFSVSITDINGKSVHQSAITTPKSEIDISSWSKGTYILTIIDNKGAKVETKKVLLH